MWELPSHQVTRNLRDLPPRLTAAKVDLRAIIDYATSFGIVAMTHAPARKASVKKPKSPESTMVQNGQLLRLR